jgi:phosphate:Na+ symporter
MIAAVGAGHEGRKVAVAHLGFKLLAALLVMPFVAWMGLGGRVAELSENLGAGPERSVANVHTVFNVLMVAAFLPFCGWMAAAFGRLVPHRATAAEKLAGGLSARLSAEPAAAIMAAERSLGDMGRRCAEMLAGAVGTLQGGGGQRIEQIRARDDEIDAIFNALNDYLSRLAYVGLDRRDAERQARVLYVARLFEEIGDLVSRELTKMAAKRAGQNLTFSMEAVAAIKRFGGGAVRDLQLVASCAERGCGEGLPSRVASVEEVDAEARALTADHFQQVCRGVAEAGESGLVYPDVISALRDVRRTIAEIARALAGGPAESEVAS